MKNDPVTTLLVGEITTIRLSRDAQNLEILFKASENTPAVFSVPRALIPMLVAELVAALDDAARGGPKQETLLEASSVGFRWEAGSPVAQMVFDTRGAEHLVVSMPADALSDVAAEIIKVIPFLGFRSSTLLN